MCPAAGADKGGNVTVLFSLSWASVNSGQQTKLAYFFHRQGTLAKLFIEGPAQVLKYHPAFHLLLAPKALLDLRRPLTYDNQSSIPLQSTDSSLTPRKAQNAF